MVEWKSIKDIANEVSSGQTTAVSLVDKSLEELNKADKYEAIIAPAAERAKKRAKEIDQAISNGEKVGRLAGVPFIAKDNFLVFGAETTAASNILKGFEAPYQSTAIEKLEAEGAICVAKANLDAFAHGSSTENSDFMVTKNPHNENRVPGGSSGGSAAAVALGIAPFALGTDTGGSIRLPASFCGVVGYKPTYGLVSRSGVVAMASSTDVIGPLCRDVDDTATVLECIAGRDELDGTTIDRPDEDISNLKDSTKKPSIGVVKDFFEQGVNPEVKTVVQDAIKKIKDAGYEIKEVSLPSISLSLACYYVICPAEVSSNLSRYDGQRYGFSNKSNDLESSYLSSRSIGFGDEAKRRIMIGTYVLSSGYYDAYYQKAQLVRTKLIKEFESAFDKADFLIGPTAPTTAFKIGEHTADPLEMYLTDIMTVAANLTGSPAISLPCGKANNLPVGLQLIGPSKSDHQLLSLSKQVEGIIK